MRAVHSPRFLLLLALIVPVGGMNGDCDLQGFPGIPDPGCTQAGTASVRITVLDADDEVVPFATIAFTVDGSQVRVTSCDGNCSDYPIAFNATGLFDIAVGSPIFEASTQTVTVEALDECTPDTEELVFVLTRDTSVAVLQGAWLTTNLFGQSILRFGEQGEIIGAILFDRTIAGDGNFYISFNNRPIRGVAGQAIGSILAGEPTRTGDRFDFVADVFGSPVGFEEGAMSEDGFFLAGTLSMTAVLYERLADIPEPLRDP